MPDVSLERRRALRVSVSIPVEVRMGRDFTLHSTKDISIGGLFFDRAIAYDVGARVTLSFRLPGDGTPIRCEGVVANIPDTHGYGMGIRFVDLGPADLDKLDAFVSEMLEGDA